MTLSAPELLTVGCEIEAFTSGVESLDTWLKRRAMKNQATGASRTFVACDGRRVAAYYALATSAVAVVEATGRFRHNIFFRNKFLAQHCALAATARPAFIASDFLSRMQTPRI